MPCDTLWNRSNSCAHHCPVPWLVLIASLSLLVLQSWLHRHNAIMTVSRGQDNMHSMPVMGTTCRQFTALEESQQMWLAMMKACRLRGAAGHSGLRLCAGHLMLTLSNISEAKVHQHKIVEGENLMLQALVVCIHVLLLACLLNHEHRRASDSGSDYMGRVLAHPHARSLSHPPT